MIGAIILNEYFITLEGISEKPAPLVELRL
jgi:hypothetical protein